MLAETAPEEAPARKPRRIRAPKAAAGSGPTKVTRRYRLHPTPEQERQLLVQVAHARRLWNGMAERDRLKGQRTLIECLLSPGKIAYFEREARRAYGRLKRAEEAVARLAAETIRPTASDFELALATQAKEMADAALAAVLPPRDAPFAPFLTWQDIKQVKPSVPAFADAMVSILRDTHAEYADSQKSFFALLKQVKKNALPRGLIPRPPTFRIGDESATLSCQVPGTPSLWRRSLKAQAGLIAAGLSTHSRYGDLKVPGVGGRIKFRLGRYGLPSIKPADPTQKTPPQPVVRISRDLSGRWHVCFSVDAPKHQVGGRRPVGVDLGIAVPITLSTGEMSQTKTQRGSAVEVLEVDGKRIKRRRPGMSAGLRLAMSPMLSDGEERDRLRLDRRIARNLDRLRATKDDAERDRLRVERRELKRQRNVYRCRLDDRRRDWIEQSTTRLARRSRTVFVEDLTIQNMSRSAAGTTDAPGTGVAAKRGLNRSIMEACWGRWKQRLAQKVTSRGGTCRAVDPKHTSQTCSTCGNVAAESRIERGTYRCIACGREAHADVNAARNILARGLREISEGTDSAGDARGPEASTGIAGASAISPAITSVGEPHPTDSTSRRNTGRRVRAPLKARKPRRRSKPEKTQESGSDPAIGTGPAPASDRVLEKHRGRPRND